MQAVLEFQVTQDDRRQILAAHGIHRVALVRVELFALRQVVDEQGALAIEQAAVQIESLGFFGPLPVTPLVADIDQGVEQDQQQGDERWPPPVQGLFGG
ncbi:hypothetical protein D9M70_517100 [compost metagenome]